MISETTIEQSIIDLSEDKPDIVVQLPDAIVDFLKRERWHLLYDVEYELLWLITEVILRSFHVTYLGKSYDVVPDYLEAIEEGVWFIMEKRSKMSFRDRLDPFFEITGEEDVLAFIEDSLIDDGEDSLTQPGREMVFVAGCALLFALEGVNPEVLSA